MKSSIHRLVIALTACLLATVSAGKVLPVLSLFFFKSHRLGP